MNVSRSHRHSSLRIWDNAFHGVFIRCLESTSLPGCPTFEIKTACRVSVADVRIFRVQGSKSHHVLARVSPAISLHLLDTSKLNYSTMASSKASLPYGTTSNFNSILFSHI